MQQTQTQTYGYSEKDYKKFKKYGWLMMLSFGLTYLLIPKEQR